MKRPQKPLMLAYILFLIIALVYYLIARVCDFEFRAWESIIVAVTIASYSFSLSSICKCLMKQYEEYRKLLNQYLNLSKKLRQKEKERLKECESRKKLLNNGEYIIKHTIELISLCENQVRRKGKVSFWLDMSGYLTFFCIICFDFVCNFFYSSQDFFTLLAFIILMIVEYVESVITTKYEEVFKVLIKSTQDTIEHLEDENNG